MSATISNPTTTRAWGATVVAVLTLAALLWGAVAIIVDELDKRSQASASAEEQQPTESGRAAGPSSRALARALGRTVHPWLFRRSRSGLFVDPITGGAGRGYGQAMLGEGLMREGRRSSNRRMLRAGIDAVTRTARRSTLAGEAENPLQLLAVASAYRWARREIADDPHFARAAPSWRHYLSSWRRSSVGEKAQACFAARSCWNNYKLLEATAVLELSRTRTRGEGPRLGPAHRRARRAAIRVLTRGVPRAMGRRAFASGPSGSLARLGILSDQPTYALAYHALSAAALARGMELLGPAAPEATLRSLRRAMDAQAAFMAPDGDPAYIGRAQGEVWALAASTYAGKACARVLAGSAPATAGRCLTLAERSLARLRSRHGFGPFGLNIVPRFRGEGLDGRGLDRYARILSFNGLSAFFLGWAADQPRPQADVRRRRLPLDGGGYFVDREKTKFAVLRHGDTWLAVHGVGRISGNDLRYDFGLVALKVRGSDGRWRDVLRPRPVTGPGQQPDSAGPVLLDPSGPGFPVGTAIGARRGGAEIVVRGGFRTVTGRWLRRGVAFRYRALRDGVEISFGARAGERYRLQDFLPRAATSAEDGGRVLRSSGVVSRVSPAPAASTLADSYASAYDAELTAYQRVVEPPRGLTLRWILRQR